MPPIHRDKTLEEYSTGSSSIEAPTGLYNFGVHKKLSCTNPLEEYFNGGGSTSSKSHEGMTSAAAKQLKLSKEKVVSPEGSGIMPPTSSYTSAAAAQSGGREYSHLNSRCTYTPTAAAAMAAAAEMAAAASAAAAASSHSPHHQLMPQTGLHYYHTNF